MEEIQFGNNNRITRNRNVITEKVIYRVQT